MHSLRLRPESRGANKRMRQRILVTPRSLSVGSAPSLDPIRKAGYEIVVPAPGRMPTELELLESVPSCIGWIAGVERVSSAVIDSAVRLRAISRNGTGVDNLPLERMRESGIRLVRAEGANANAVAELALGLSIAGLRGIVDAHVGIRSGGWPRIPGKEVRGSKIAVIGLGAVGRIYARLCVAMGARVRGVDPHVEDDSVRASGFQTTDLLDALKGANVVSLHCPMPDDRSPVIGAKEFDTMLGCSVLVNTARSRLVDERSLQEALDEGRVGAYAADVFDEEPPTGSFLLTHDRAILTSHIGALTGKSARRAADIAVNRLLRALNESAGVGSG